MDIAGAVRARRRHSRVPRRDASSPSLDRYRAPPGAGSRSAVALRMIVERAMGIEPTCAAWKAAVLPLNYARRGRPRPRTRGDGEPGGTHAGARAADREERRAVLAEVCAVRSSLRRAVAPAGRWSGASAARPRTRRGSLGLRPARCAAARRWWGEQDSNLRRLSHQIYSLTPLAARESPHAPARRRLRPGGHDGNGPLHRSSTRISGASAGLPRSTAGLGRRCAAPRTPRGLDRGRSPLPCHPVNRVVMELAAATLRPPRPTPARRTTPVDRGRSMEPAVGLEPATT